MSASGMDEKRSAEGRGYRTLLVSDIVFLGIGGPREALVLRWM